jgi:hypothetical protein
MVKLSLIESERKSQVGPGAKGKYFARKSIEVFYQQ